MGSLIFRLVGWLSADSKGDSIRFLVVTMSWKLVRFTVTRLPPISTPQCLVATLASNSVWKRTNANPKHRPFSASFKMLMSSSVRLESLKKV